VNESRILGFTFGGINFAGSSFRGFSLNVYAEEQVCQITTRISPTDQFPMITALPPTAPRAAPDGRIVDLSDDVLLEFLLELVGEVEPNVRVV